MRGPGAMNFLIWLLTAPAANDADPGFLGYDDGHEVPGAAALLAARRIELAGPVRTSVPYLPVRPRPGA